MTRFTRTYAKLIPKNLHKHTLANGCWTDHTPKCTQTECIIAKRNKKQQQPIIHLGRKEQTKEL